MNAKVSLGARYVLGLIYFVFGLNGFLEFLPMPSSLPAGAMSFMAGLASSGYFIPVLKGAEVLGGALLLAGIAAPVALVVLAPITIHIFLFHAILTPGLQNLGMPVFMIALHVAAALRYWPSYQPLFRRG